MFLVQTTLPLLTWLVIPHQNPQRPMTALVVLSYVRRRNPLWRNTLWNQNLQQAVGNKAVYLRFHWLGVGYTLHSEEQADPCRHKMIQLKKVHCFYFKRWFYEPRLTSDVYTLLTSAITRCPWATWRFPFIGIDNNFEWTLRWWKEQSPCCVSLFYLLICASYMEWPVSHGRYLFT